MRSFFHALVTLLSLATLTSCASATLSTPQQTTNLNIPQPIASELRADPQATVTVAGMDIDGQSASASGFIQGIIEDGGSCEFVFTHGDSVVTASVNGVSNVTSTACGLVTVSKSSLQSGNWQVSLHYKGASGDELVSAPVSFEVV